jgi:hypothetical protein
VPTATRVAVLVNPADEMTTKSTLTDVEAAARAIGLRIQVFNADSSRDYADKREHAKHSNETQRCLRQQQCRHHCRHSRNGEVMEYPRLPRLSPR